MGARKGNKNAVGNSGGGVSYYPKIIAKAGGLENIAKFMESGATGQQLAEHLGVLRITINVWRKKYPEFGEAYSAGKEAADDKIERSLFERAQGYEHDEDHVVYEDGRPKTYTAKKRYPPDVTACIFWLKNRRPDVWREKSEVDNNLKITAPTKVEITFADA